MSDHRWQPPAFSPLPLRALGAAFVRPRSALPRLKAYLAEAFAAQQVCLCGSGREALQLALVAALVRARATTVALPAYCCPEVASAAIGAGARIALYDVEPETLAPEPRSLERALRAGARVVVAAPLYGIPLPWQDIATLVRRWDAVLVEDAAQGHGASWRGRPLGSLGVLTVLSFGRGKGWTGGGGGALLVRAEAGSAPLPARMHPVAALVERISPEYLGWGGTGTRVLLRASAQALLQRPTAYAVPRRLRFLALGETRYTEPTPPRTMVPAAAALLLASAVSAAMEADLRRLNAAQLLEGLADVPGVRPIRPPPDAVAGYLRLPLRLPRGMASLADPGRAERLGVAPGYPRTLASWPQVRAHLVAPEQHLPGAEALAGELVTLPTHSRLAPADRRALLELLRRDAPAGGGAPMNPQPAGSP